VRHLLYLAWQYLRFNKGKTVVLVGSISLVIFLPAGLYVMIEQGSQTLTARAEATPLLIGPQGSASDLTLSALYFRKPTLKSIAFEQVKQVNESGFAFGIPLHLRYAVEEQPIIGTTLDYFDFRGLTVSQGRQTHPLVTVSRKRDRQLRRRGIARRSRAPNV